MDLGTNQSQGNKLAETTDEDELFYFESDHLALKGNKDYSKILKTIFILEAQRRKAIKDFDKVAQLEEKALQDPQSFIEKLKNRESLGIPDMQIIAEIPKIDWASYNVEKPESLDLKEFSGETPRAKFSPSENNKRINTHNVKWSVDEQRKLEELLHKYPPEAIELRRFKKIANEMPNRTVKQVISRVQKYFSKLIKAGEPVPGRMPKYAERYKKSKLHSHQKYNHYLFKPTTFFPHFDVPVTLNEVEETPGPNFSAGIFSKTSNYLLPNSSHAYSEHEVQETVEDFNKQVDVLEKVKYNLLNSASETLTYTGYQCLSCKTDIIGVRWHCLSCPVEAVNYCNNCIVFLLESKTSHLLTHEFEVVYGDKLEAHPFSESSNDSKFSTNDVSCNKNIDSNNETTSCSDSDDDNGELTSVSDSFDLACSQ